MGHYFIYDSCTNELFECTLLAFMELTADCYLEFSSFPCGVVCYAYVDSSCRDFIGYCIVLNEEV